MNEKKIHGDVWFYLDHLAPTNKYQRLRSMIAIRYVLRDSPSLWFSLSHLIDLEFGTTSIEGYCD